MCAFLQAGQPGDPGHAGLFGAASGAVLPFGMAVTGQGLTELTRTLFGSSSFDNTIAEVGDSRLFWRASQSMLTLPSPALGATQSSRKQQSIHSDFITGT